MTSVHSIDNFEYYMPCSLNEALKRLENNNNSGKALAGGTDLIVQMKQGIKTPSFLVDIKRVPELNILEYNKMKGLRIGAAVPIGRLLTLKGLPKEYEILLQACSLIGSMQIKNRGTIGGNICNASPSADSAPPLLCLEASVNVSSIRGNRSIPIEYFFVAPGKNALGDDELLVEIEIPEPPANSAGCYLRHTTKKEMDIAVAGVASFLTISPEKEILQTARIALGAVASTPVRMQEAEKFLTNKKITQNIINDAARIASDESSPISDLRGSEEYRREIVRVLTQRTLMKTCESLGIEI